MSNTSLRIGLQKHITIPRVILLGLLLIGLWFFRPLVHQIAYGAVVAYPGVLQWLLVGGVMIGFLLIWARTRETSDRQKGKLAFWIIVGGGVATLIVAVLIGGFGGGVYMNTNMADEVAAETTDIDRLPETDESNARILPYEVSYEYSQNSLQYPRHRLAGGDITYINGTPHWSYALAPDGTLNSLYAESQQGGVYTNMSTSGSDVNVRETTFKTGQGMMLTRNYEWQLKKDEYWASYQDPIMVPHDDSQYIVVPYVEHDRDFQFTPIPQAYSTPQFGEEKSGLLHQIAQSVGLADEGEEYGGVKIIHPDGTIEDVEPSEAQDHPILEDQRVYPYDLAKFEVNSMQYQHGAINAWLYHDDQLELAPAPGQGNDQPFTVTTDSGITYFTAAEPWGDASGVYQIWVHDGQTGEKERLRVNLDSAMVGPASATEYVMTEIERQGLNPVEPVPAVVDGTLYWQIKVLPEDGRGIAYTAFVNGETNDVTLVRSDADVRSFLAEGDVDGVTNPENDTEDETRAGEGSLTITIEHPDGSTEQIEVDEGSTVTVESNPPEAAENNSSGG